MNSLKQALIQLKEDWRNSLLLGCIATIFVLLVRFVPYLSAFVISMGLLFLQEISNQYSQARKWPQQFNFIKQHLLSFVVTALILLPTSALLGSAMGLLQSPQDILQTIPLSLGLLILALYFYLILNHALRLNMENDTSLAKAIDIVALASIKNFKEYFLVSFYLSVAILISGLLWGFGFIVTLPFVFFATNHIYRHIKDKGALNRKTGI
ncbi:hypothetical protein EZJ49_04665 [Bdellovibrio bacteriovorus]|uniref:hypothetical protein n=1 Tax=Bdellovibrio bacteriovorus TaxID=959 RepID=UPI0021D0C124|nr:hypothetical protein [Bdellovibrio bacteriovorus]UXR65543.1 hypothetical protein EZJ49_04665 [Bdellovibrio bacteriovorus]